MKPTTAIIFSALFLSLVAVGCGGTTTPDCSTLAGITVSPTAATASHTAAAPGNQQPFSSNPLFHQGCPALPLAFGFAAWSVSDPVNVSISNARDSTYGTATCIGATAGPLTVTATATLNGSTVSGSASLTCN